MSSLLSRCVASCPPYCLPFSQGALDDLGDYDPEKLKVVGTCQDLEKGYFRLTSAPPPERVRPEQVLALALKHLQKKWQRRDDENIKYIWVCDQLKAVRVKPRKLNYK